MITIGLTGGSGAGKGTVSEILMELGIPSIDTDAVYRELVSYGSPCLRELIAFFGEKIITPDGALDRKVLADIVFAPGGSKKLYELNKITHKHILDECRIRLAIYSESGYDIAVIDAPQLYESGFNHSCDYVIAVLANSELRLKRIIERDGIDEDHARARISSQKSDNFFLERADYVVYNNGALESLRMQIKDVIADIYAKSRGENITEEKLY